MTDGFVRITPDSSGKAIDNTVYTRDGLEIYRQRTECYAGETFPVSGPLTDAQLRASRVGVTSYNGSPVNVDLDGATRSSQKLTMFDGKIYNAEDTFKWDTKGTGTATYTNNAIRLSVAAGQYMIRQSRSFCPYFSGKPQLIESTSFNFNPEDGLTKRIGYFSSNAVAPYDSDKDGWWLEASGGTHRLITSRAGTITHDIAWADMDAVKNGEITTYDWSKFSVTKVDFLWLGGAGLRFFLVVNGVFKLIHTIANHAGYQDQLIFNNPNQPVRYEIRSTTGTGALTSVCSQVSTEGTGTNEMGEGLAIYTPGITCNAIGTIYALAGARKTAANRNHFVPVTEFGATNVLTSATPESGVLLLMLNPTLSAPLTWTANSRIETAIATNQTITNPGRILKAVTMSGGNVSAQAPSAALRILGCGIDNTMGQLLIGYTPLTANQVVAGMMQVMEY